MTPKRIRTGGSAPPIGALCSALLAAVRRRHLPLDRRRDTRGVARCAAAFVGGLPENYRVKLPGIDAKHPLDCSGRPRQGIASFYARPFRWPQDGRRHGDASEPRQRRQPHTATRHHGDRHESADRIEGPRHDPRPRSRYVGGRLIDLSPATARKIGLEPRQGLALVEVAPIRVAVPMAPCARFGFLVRPPHGVRRLRG